jgi:hypothetical protein
MRLFFPGKTEREEQEQLRSELTSRMQALEQSLAEERDQLRAAFTNGIQALEQTLLEEVRRLTIPPDLSPIRSEFANKMQALERSLAGEIQQFNPALASISSGVRGMEQSLAEMRDQLRTDFAGRMQALERSLVGEGGQIRTELTSRIKAAEQALIKEIQPLRTPPDFSQLRADFSNKVKAVEQVLLREIQQGRISPELVQVPGKLDQLQGQVEALSSLVTQLSPVQADGESKPIREMIKVRIDAAMAALNELSKGLGDWLEERHQDDQQTKQAFDEAQKRLQTSMAHLSPSEQEQREEP